MIRLSLLIGLPLLACLWLLASVLKWPPPPFWRTLQNVAAVLAVGYLAWAIWTVLTLP